MSVTLKAYLTRNVRQLILRVRCDPREEDQIMEKMQQIRKLVQVSGADCVFFLKDPNPEEFSSSFSRFMGSDNKTTYESCFWVNKAASGAAITVNIRNLVTPFFLGMRMDLYVEEPEEEKKTRGEEGGNAATYKKFPLHLTHLI